MLPHLKKCFEGVNSLEFQSDMSITAMVSKEKEVVQFDYEAISEKTINPNDSGGCVEIWLDLNSNRHEKITAHLYDLSMVDYAKREPDGDRTGWLKDWPGQIVFRSFANVLDICDNRGIKVWAQRHTRSTSAIDRSPQ